MLDDGNVYVGDEIDVVGYYYIDDALTDPTDVTLNYIKPDGTTGTDSPTKVSTGYYRSSITMDDNGYWFFEMVATGTVKKKLFGRQYVQKTPFES